ncbi:hypothetical protein ACHAXA_010265 [Cyclostephanos tholiformis]|uniref:Response regulatory domain-containing protein n=1 Tax=Cyclostephanos tholiformis TaxID=382380 RepID=A0ABD3RSD0_9STRA
MDAIHACISYLSKHNRNRLPPRPSATTEPVRDAPRRRSGRRPDTLRDVPVILLTARAMISDRIVGYDAGADGYLPKPFRPEELLGMIDNLMRRRRRGTVDRGGRDVDDNLSDVDDWGHDIVGGESWKGDLTMEQAREITDDLVEIKELIKARMMSMEGGGNDSPPRERLLTLLPEATWMYRTGERRKRVFTRDHIKSILSTYYDVDVASKKNARWDDLWRELESLRSERPKGLLFLDEPVDNY